jgi:hypothetical protein
MTDLAVDRACTPVCCWCHGTGACECANAVWDGERVVTGTWWETPCPFCGGSGTAHAWPAPAEPNGR